MSKNCHGTARGNCTGNKGRWGYDTAAENIRPDWLGKLRARTHISANNSQLMDLAVEVTA